MTIGCLMLYFSSHNPKVDLVDEAEPIIVRLKLAVQTRPYHLGEVGVMVVLVCPLSHWDQEGAAFGQEARTPCYI